MKRILTSTMGLLLAGLGAMAQSLTPITVEVSAVTGVSTQGLTVELYGDESGWVFDPVKVNAQGVARFANVPDGVYVLTVDGSPYGLETYIDNALEHNGAQTVEVTLKEAVRTPYALNATLSHDEFTGLDNALLSWNKETDYFFDDFESYEPFAIEFSPWTGHDIDKEPAAEIQGYYPNRGTQQYATIFNALTIDPPVYYEYPVLRPYSGKQCVGFVRTRSGNANNDWLISPKIKVGVNNVVSFMAKGSEYQPDRFAVCVSTTGTDVKDFVQLTPGNYETVDYKAWKEVAYSLSKYEGQEVYIAIHCTSQNSFMLMIDDFYVGPTMLPRMARRVSRHSAANPNEVFVITLDGNEVGTTEDTEFNIAGIPSGAHTVGVQARYVVASSDVATINLDVPGADNYARLTLKMSADFDTDLTGVAVNILNTASARQTRVETDAEGVATVASLAKGTYMINIASDLFDEYNDSFELTGDKTLDILLKETIRDPFNLFYEVTPRDDAKSDVELWWNQDLGFRDSFEDYDDFTQKIGDWTVIDGDRMPTYAFSIGGTIITKPESREEVGAMVFNPYATEPVQASEDGLFIAPDGDKYVMFNSAEMAFSDDWLISPTVRIGSDYVLRFTAKSYSDSFPGDFEFYAIRNKDVATAELLDLFYLNDQWVRYEIGLAAYQGESIEIGFHHTTYDGWISFIDDVYVGPGDEADAGDANLARCSFDVFLDGTLLATVEEPYYRFTALSPGVHKAGIQALYPSGRKSNVTEIEFTVDENGVYEITAAPQGADWRYFDLNGMSVDPEHLAPGIYIRTCGPAVEKVVVK